MIVSLSDSSMLCTAFHTPHVVVGKFSATSKCKPEIIFIRANYLFKLVNILSLF